MTTNPSAVIGANVRAEMARRGISQTALAMRLQKSQTAVSKRLRGETPFDVNELATVAAALNVPMGALTAGVEAVTA